MKDCVSFIEGAPKQWDSFDIGGFFSVIVKSVLLASIYFYMGYLIKFLVFLFELIFNKYF